MFLRLEVIKKLLETAVLILTVRIGVFAMALGQLFCGVASLLINAWPNRRLLDYPYRQQLRDVLPVVCLSLVMAAAVWPVSLLGLPDLLTLLIQIPLGVSVYVLGSVLLKLDSFELILSMVKKALRRGGKEEANG